jgi:hypothetical protein
MNKDEVVAFRESERISQFLKAMVAQGKMTAFEEQIVRQEGHEIYRQAGYFDRHSRHQADMGDEAAAVIRQSNHRERQKILQIHPEMQAELDRFVEHREHHPLPPVSPGLAKPGAALAQYHSLIDYIARKRDQGVIEHEKAHEMYAPALQLFKDSGVFHSNLSEQTDKALLLQAHHLIKKKLLDFYPELGDDLRNQGYNFLR